MNTEETFGENLLCILCSCSADMDGGIVFFEGTSFCKYCFEQYLKDNPTDDKEYFLTKIKEFKEEEKK